MLGNLLVPILIAVAAVLLIIIIAMGYVKARPDQAIIISGLRKKPKVLIGRAGIKIPFLERKDTLIIKQIGVDIKTNGYIPTKDFIGINVDAIAKIKVKTDEQGIKLAMENFLNMTEQQIVAALTDSLQGNMREIIGTIDLKAICNERKQFGDQVQEKAQKDMNALGIEIISCNIQKAEDENGLINALGQDNMAQIQKNAAIAKAAADRDVKIAQAQANKESNDAEVASKTEIAQKQNQLEITQAELKIQADIKRAEADAAYKIQEQEQRKSIEVTAAAADIAKQEKAIELKAKEAAVKEQELAASIKKKADADKYAEEQQAEVELFKRKKDAEAKRFEEEQKAEARKATALAEKFAKEQEAEGIRMVGQAEAEAIRAKGLAEAEGIDKKAEAMKKMGEASVLEMFFQAYPQIMEAAAKPLTNVDSITMYGDGNSTKLIKDIVNTTTQVVKGVEDSTGISLQSLLAGFLGGKLADAKAPAITVPSNTNTDSDVDISTEE